MPWAQRYRPRMTIPTPRCKERDTLRSHDVYTRAPASTRPPRIGAPTSLPHYNDEPVEKYLPFHHRVGDGVLVVGPDTANQERTPLGNAPTARAWGRL